MRVAMVLRKRFVPITSTENSPAVSIRIMTKGRGIAPNQKIHFIPKGSHS